MGKPAQRRRKPARKSPQPSHSAKDVEAVDMEVKMDIHAHHDSNNITMPPCVVQLHKSTEYAVLEDACADVATFSTQARHNAAFLTEGVPQRLTELLLFTSPIVLKTLGEEEEEDNGTAATPNAAAVPHKGILYMQIAAAEALRSLVTNSEEDRVVDALTAAGAVDAKSGLGFADGLVQLVREDWARVQQARRAMTPEDWMDHYQEQQQRAMDGEKIAEDDEEQEGEAGSMAEMGAGQQQQSTRRARQSGATRNLYFTLLRHLEEALALAAVCVEASEACATAFSDPSALCLLLEVLRVATTSAWETLLHPQAAYYDDGATAGVVPDTVCAMRSYKRREASLLAALSVVAADGLLLLSPENASLASLLSLTAMPASSTVAASASSEQRAFLEACVDAVDLRAWLAGKPSAEMQLAEAFCDDVLPTFVGAQHTVIAMERERVLYDLLRATIAVHGILLHLSPTAENLQRVIPLLADALHKTSLPMRVWCALLPLLMDSSDAGDSDVRAAAVQLGVYRLRSTQAAVRLLHIFVNAIGEKNDERLSAAADDEAAFASNPLAPLLQSGNLFYAVGLLLKDVLWVTNTTSSSRRNGRGDIMTTQAQQRALRAEASANASATEMQMVLLSTEVNVWEVASTLLLMLPVTSLGDPAVTWRSLMVAVQHRYQLHLDAASASASDALHASNGASRQVSIVQHAASAQQLLWLQLESLTQMLWTMQRKQSKTYGGALAAANGVHATAGDVDLLTRVSWESAASAGVRQACVGTVVSLCTSMQSVEAAATAARYAVAVMAKGGPAAVFAKTLSEAAGSTLVIGSVPVDPVARQQWRQKLAVLDAAATVRSEAANALMDLFLDERYDATVYWPLGVQEGLRSCKQQLGPYVKRRALLDKETRRKFHLSTETAEAEQWAEVLENVDGFLDYKVSHK